MLQVWPAGKTTQYDPLLPWIKPAVFYVSSVTPLLVKPSGMTWINCYILRFKFQFLICSTLQVWLSLLVKPSGMTYMHVSSLMRYFQVWCILHSSVIWLIGATTQSSFIYQSGVKIHWLTTFQVCSIASNPNSSEGQQIPCLQILISKRNLLSINFGCVHLRVYCCSVVCLKFELTFQMWSVITGILDSSVGLPTQSQIQRFHQVLVVDCGV